MNILERLSTRIMKPLAMIEEELKRVNSELGVKLSRDNERPRGWEMTARRRNGR